MGYLSIALTALYYIFYPIIYLLNLTFPVLLLISAPCVQLVRYLSYACWSLFQLFSKFEVRF